MKLFFHLLSICILLSCKSPLTKQNHPKEGNKDGIQSILQKIVVPKIPKRSIDISTYNTTGKTNFNYKPAIDSAIEKLSQLGGGKLVFPKGNYLCNGPIILKSNIHLYLEEGATLNFSQDPKDYLPLQLVRWEGVNLYNYSPYIYAKNAKNISITGKGILNGNGSKIASWRKKQKIDQNLSRKMGKNQVPLEKRMFGDGHYLRMSFIQLMYCSNILIDGVQIVDVPFWVVHPTYSNSITIKNIRINSTKINNDGIDIDSCEDVLVENCNLNVGDDAVAIKSGRDQDAWKVNKPSKNIIVRNCVAENVLHGMAFGSEMSGGMENVYVSNFKMKNVRKYAIQFKANKDRGGYIKKIIIDGVTIQNTKTAILFTNDYHSYSGGNSPSDFYDIEIKNLNCNQARGRGIEIKGLKENPIRKVTLENINIQKERAKSTISNFNEGAISNVIIENKPFE